MTVPDWLVDSSGKKIKVGNVYIMPDISRELLLGHDYQAEVKEILNSCPIYFCHGAQLTNREVCPVRDSTILYLVLEYVKTSGVEVDREDVWVYHVYSEGSTHRWELISESRDWWDVWSEK